ncbi:hypothetical protein, partial [Nitrosomonas sp.]|uniref:hypothetical protein n=1 Tax=Nitrosomonas sp. TaxID=42353 RepID=UPI001D9920AE
IDPTGEIAWIPIIIGATLYAGSQSTSLQNAAASSAQYWANQQNQTGNSFYTIPGSLAALADSCNIQTTTAVLGVGALAGAYLGRPFWQYYPASNPAYSSSWFTRGWGWKPPYSTGQQAIEKLALPAYNPATAVRSVNPPWWKPVRGPRPVETANNQPGGGIEYIQNIRW